MVAVTNADAHSRQLQPADDRPPGRVRRRRHQRRRQAVQRVALHRQRVGEARARASRTRRFGSASSASLGGTTNFHTVIGNTTVTANEWVRLSATYDFVVQLTEPDALRRVGERNAVLLHRRFRLDVRAAAGGGTRHHRRCTRRSRTIVPGRRRGLAGRPGRRARVPALETLQQRHLRKRHEVGHVEPTEGTFAFATADAQVAFAKAHNMAVRATPSCGTTRTPPGCSTTLPARR